MKIFLCILLLAVSSVAADINGTWKGTAETEAGTAERTWVFKTDGTKVTGETSSNFAAKSSIDNGKLEGDKLTFDTNANLGGTEMKLTFVGKVDGEKITFQVDGPGGVSIVYNAQKVK